MNKLKHFLLNSKNINKSSFIWNMAGSMLMAFQSVIMLMIITRTLNLYEAGVFTLAYASANLFLNIGKYGMRNFKCPTSSASLTSKNIIPPVLLQLY